MPNNMLRLITAIESAYNTSLSIFAKTPQQYSEILSFFKEIKETCRDGEFLDTEQFNKLIALLEEIG